LRRPASSLRVSARTAAASKRVKWRRGPARGPGCLDRRREFGSSWPAAARAGGQRVRRARPGCGSLRAPDWPLASAHVTCKQTSRWIWSDSSPQP
jgi:hypothetical protein